MSKRLLLSLLPAIALLPHAQAQTYPDHPLRLVVPFATGGTSDILARFVASPLWAAIGQPVVVDNRPGAGSNVGNEIVAKAAPDGYTLLMATPALASNQALYGKLNYDPLNNFSPVTLVAEIPIALVVHPSMPTKTVKELIALAKAQPDKLNFGSSGNGGIGHLVGEMFKSATGIKMTHVPYKGNGPALVDLMSGVLNLTFTDIAGGMPYIKAGKMRPLGITTKRRSAQLPDVPTMNEAGVPGFEASTWFAVFATGGTPRPVINRLNAEIVKSLQTPEMREKLTNLGCDVVGNKPEELTAFFKAEMAKWSKVIRESGAKVE
ncbi:MAG: transporter substrate-binding protein [Betaproteobacteria bacterium]|nr:transporter substrate-binding protein [Betaproteobacteria bacterium]